MAVRVPAVAVALPCVIIIAADSADGAHEAWQLPQPLSLGQLLHARPHDRGLTCATNSPTLVIVSVRQSGGIRIDMGRSAVLVETVLLPLQSGGNTGGTARK